MLDTFPSLPSNTVGNYMSLVLSLNSSFTTMSDNEDTGIIEEKQESIFVDWKIKDFFRLRFPTGEAWKSPTFQFSGAEWYLRINAPLEFGKAIEMYLCKYQAHSLIHHVNFIIGIKNNDGTYFASKNCIHSFDDDGYGTDNLVKQSHLASNRKEVCVNDTITFFCIAEVTNKDRVKSSQTSNLDDISIMKRRTEEEKDAIAFSEGVDILLGDLKNLFLNEVGSDVIINVKEHKFQGHRCIISARSPVFAKMFNHDTKEKTSGIIDIPDVEPDIFENFLFYMYAAKVENLSTDIAIRLYSVADKYEVKHLMQECVRFIVDNFSVDAFCDILLLAVQHNEPRLMKSAEEFFFSNAEKILLTLKWQAFINENGSVANELFIKFLRRSDK